MFDSSGEDESRNVATSCIMSENGVHPGWSGVPLTSLPRLPPHGSAPPAPPPVPGSCHTVAVKLPLQVNTCLSYIPKNGLDMPSALGLVDNILHCRIPVLFRALIQPLPTTCGTVSMCDCLGVRKISTHRSRRGGRCWLAGANVRLLIQSFSYESRWQLVVNALTSAPITSSRDLEQAIMLYNTRYKDKYDWSFDGLHHLFEEVLEPEETEAFFGKTMPGMVELLTASPSIITSPLPLLKSGKTHSITLSQQQVHHVWIMFLSQRIFSLCLV